MKKPILADSWTNIFYIMAALVVSTQGYYLSAAGLVFLGVTSFAGHHKLLSWRWDWAGMYFVTAAIPFEFFLPLVPALTISVVIAGVLDQLWDGGKSDREYIFIGVLFLGFLAGVFIHHGASTLGISTLLFLLGFICQRHAESAKRSAHDGYLSKQYQVYHSIWHFLTAAGYAVGTLGI